MKFLNRLLKTKKLDNKTSRRSITHLALACLSVGV